MDVSIPSPWPSPAGRGDAEEEVPIYNRANITARDLAILKARLQSLEAGFPAGQPPRQELAGASASSLKLVLLDNGLHSLAYWFYDEREWRFPAHSGKVVRWWNLPDGLSERI